MAISVKWYDKDKTIIVTKLEDPWTLDDFIEARKKWHRMIKNVSYYVPIILDLSATFDPPAGVLRQFIAIHRTPHPRQGHVFVFGLNPSYEKLSQHLFDGAVDESKQVRLVDSLDEAIRACQA